MEKLWLYLAVMAVAGLALFYWLLRKRYRAMQQKQKGYQPPQTRFGYAPHAPAQEWDLMDGAFQKLYQQFCWLFVPMLFYAGLALAVVTRNAAQYDWMAAAMYALAGAGCALGAVETVLLLFPKEAGKIARVFGLAKWACFGVWVVGMFAGLFIRSWSM